MTLVTPIVDAGLGNTSWVVDLGDGRLAVVDPGRHPGPYLAEAERRRARIAYTVETHLHADFVTGSRELAALGATVVAPAGAGLAWPHRPVADGDTVDLGGLALRPLATPGHTPEHLAYVLLAADGSRPLGAFTGGSLLVGAVARTDLIAPEATEGLARAQWRSIHDRLLALPDATPVYPTHGAGSFCSAPATGRRATTIGDERRTNPLLAAGDEDAFVAALLGRLGSYPPYFLHLREVNRAGPDVLGVPQPGLPRLDLVAFQRVLESGAELVDVRPVAAWAAGHVPGALANPLRDQFASWLGWLVERDRPVVFVVGDEQDRTELVRQCHQIGHDRLEGELDGGMAAWAAAGLPVARTPLLPAGALGDTPVLDVRQAVEHEAGHVPGAAHLELGALRALADAGPAAGARAGAGAVLPGTAGEVEAVMCGHGERAATAASLLERSGRPGVPVVVGGPSDWAAAIGRDLATGGGPATGRARTSVSR